MPIDVPTLAQQTAFSQSFSRSPMAIHTPYQKPSSDDRPYSAWNNYTIYEGTRPGLASDQTDALTAISLLGSLRLFFHYIKALQEIGHIDLKLALPIFGKTVKFLLSRGIAVDKISIANTPDNSVLVKGITNESSFHFETYFDNTEYVNGYEVISNVFANNELRASSAGSIDFVLENSRL